MQFAKIFNKNAVFFATVAVLFCLSIAQSAFAGTIVGWGNSIFDSGELDCNDFVSIAAGGAHSLALKSDGSVVGWGWDYYGQATPPDGNDFVGIAAGVSHSLALRSDGSVTGWGHPDFGQAVPPEGSDFVAVVAGYLHSLALRSDGSIVGWGRNVDHWGDWCGQATPPDGNDFVAIAAGEELRFAQKDVSRRGHALECRVYAEDAAANFLPSAGKILFLREPIGPGVRLDGGIYGGYDVPVHYDPILAKLITWGTDRDEARRRMAEALRDYVIVGIKTTVPFLRDVVEHPAYVAGETNTGFIADHFDGWREDVPAELVEKALAAAGAAELVGGPAKSYTDGDRAAAPTPWQTVGPWQNGAA